MVIVVAEKALLKTPDNFRFAADFQGSPELFGSLGQTHLAQTSSRHHHLAKALKLLLCLGYHVKAGTYNRENPPNPALKCLEVYQVPKNLLLVFHF